MDRLTNFARKKEGIQTYTVPYESLTPHAKRLVDQVSVVRKFRTVFGTVAVLPWLIPPHISSSDIIGPIMGGTMAKNANARYHAIVYALAELHKKSGLTAATTHHEQISQLKPTQMSIDGKRGVVFIRSNKVHKNKPFRTFRAKLQE